jgi:hypothetical protein
MRGSPCSDDEIPVIVKVVLIVISVAVVIHWALQGQELRFPASTAHLDPPFPLSIAQKLQLVEAQLDAKAAEASLRELEAKLTAQLLQSEEQQKYSAAVKRLKAVVLELRAAAHAENCDLDLVDKKWINCKDKGKTTP